MHSCLREREHFLRWFRSRLHRLGVASSNHRSSLKCGAGLSTPLAFCWSWPSLFSIKRKSETGSRTHQPCPKRVSNVFFSSQLQGAFPDDSNAPSQGLKLGKVPFVAPDILLELGFPERLVGAGIRTPPAVAVPMPETSVDQYRCLILRKYKIRFPREIGNVLSQTPKLGLKRCQRETAGNETNY